MIWYILGSVGQWAAFIVLAGGIAVEIHYEADIGFLAITIGSALFAGFTKLKAIGKDRELHRMKKHDRS